MAMRFGIVGLGWAARSFHVPALDDGPGVTLVGGADSSSGQRASWQRETGVPAFASLEEMLERARPDAVIVATPPDSHADVCLAALAGGAHVYCEKPFVSTVDEADRVLAAAAAANRHVAVNHEFREKPIFRVVKEQVDSGEHGRLVFCQIWQLMNVAPWDEPVPWRAAMPNRTLFEGGVHLVDLLLTLYGETPVSVIARHSSGLDPSRTADAVHLVTLEFPGNRLAQITIDRLCPAATRYVELRADCERASLRASLGGRALVRAGMKRGEPSGLVAEFATGGLAWMEQGTRRKTLARASRRAGMLATGALLGKFAAAVEAGREPPSSGREAREVIAVIAAAYRSAETAAPVAPGARTSAGATVSPP